MSWLKEGPTVWIKKFVLRRPAFVMTQEPTCIGPIVLKASSHSSYMVDPPAFAMAAACPETKSRFRLALTTIAFVYSRTISHLTI